MVTWHPEVRPCPICAQTRYCRIGRRGGRAHHSGSGVETGVVRCLGCHAVYQCPVLLPSANPYEDLPAADYFRGHDPHSKRRAGASLARQAYELLGRRGSLLEVGCGRGELLSGARDEGWTVAGIEMTAWGVPEPGLSIEVAAVDNARSLEGQYDVVVLAAILEHLYEPVRALRRVRDALSPGGLVYIDVPNECSLWARAGNAYMRVRGRDWAVNLSPTFPPFHVIGLCPRSLRRLLAETGYAALQLKLYSLSSRVPGQRGLVGKLEGAGSTAGLALGQALGMGAGMTCWATRS
jgi:SAM-dependent methyltransferase